MSYSDWERQFKSQIHKVIIVSGKVIEDVAKQFYDTVKLRTPIGNTELWKTKPSSDYVPGALRQSWNVERSGQDSKLEIDIYNNRPYAYRIETGWSTQAPAGMMRITVLDVPDMIKKAVARMKL